MSRRRVLFVTPWYPTEKNPSAGVFVREHARAAALSNDVRVLHLAGARRPPGIEEVFDEELAAGIPTWRVYHRKLPIARTDAFTQTWALSRAVAWLRREHGFAPEIIHAHVFLGGFPSVIVGKLKNLPVVVSEHYSAFPMRTLAWHDLLKARITFRLADRVLPVSLVLKQAIVACGINARFEVVPNAVDTSVFFPDRDKSGHPPPTFLYVGQLDEDKGIGDLLAALAHPALASREWSLVVVGGGGQDHWRATAADLGIKAKVSFLGSIPKREVAEWMRKGDALVVPSWFETQSVVTIEAMASGLPVLASQVGELPSMLADGGGAIFPPRNPGSQASLLIAFLDGKLDLGDLRRSERVAREYGMDRVGAQLSTIYEQVLSTHG